MQKLSLRLNDINEYTDNKFGEIIETLTSRYDIGLFFKEYCFLIIADKPNNIFKFFFTKIIQYNIDTWKVEQISEGDIETYKNIGFEFMETLRNCDEFPNLQTVDFPVDEITIRIFENFNDHFYTE